MENTTVQHNKGYTLIEALVVVAIISIIVPAIMMAITDLYETHAVTLSSSLAVVETTKGVQEIVRDIRSAVYAEDGSLPLVAIATNSFTFFSDTDFDGDVERIRYYLDADELRKGIIEPTASSSYPESTETTERLVGRTANTETLTPIFRYYSATGTEITTSALMLEVRRVEVTVVGRSRFGNETSDVTIRSSASIRNLKETY